jgi:CO/xanthine dehydrogenase Mo-binding subunit
MSHVIETAVEEKKEHSVVGRSTTRHDAYEKVTGAAIFGTDFSLPNTLHAKIVLSKVAHANIKRIDASEAERMPGVKAVVTSTDFPDVRYGGIIADQRVLARDKVIFVGQPVAAVAATTLEIAERAAASIAVEYEELPLVLDPAEAMKPESPIVHEDVKALGNPSPELKNIATYTCIRKGSIEKSFKEADAVVEEEYETQMVHQCYLEPHAATVSIDPLGKVHVWTSTQSPFSIRSGLSQVLQLPINQIEVKGTYAGGGFGSKIAISIEPICAVLARKTKRPIKMVLTREEEFLCTTPRPAIKFWIKSAVKLDGSIIARKAKAVVDSGAYGSEGAVYANIAAIQLNGPYNIPNVSLEGYAVYTNKQGCGAFRAPGSAETAFAAESHTDSLAAAIGMDPLEFRLRNAWDEGSVGPTGQVMHGVGLKEALRRTAKMIGWKSQSAANVGYGIGCGLIPSVGIHSSGSIVKLNDDGSVLVITGVPDTGSGAVTGLKMIAAEELSIPLSQVAIINADTDIAPWDGGTQGSRTTFGAGNAVLRAANDAKNQVISLAARMLKVKPEALELKDGSVSAKDGSVSVPLSKVVAYSYFTFGGPIFGRGSFVLDWPPYDRDTIDGFFILPSFHDPTYTAHAALVEVNPATGKITVKAYSIAQDVGFAINPSGIEAQMHGGLGQGLGYALTEVMTHDSFGNVINSNLAEYKLPTIVDVPATIQTSIVEGYYGSGPYGAKGVGEANIVPPAAAVGNAVFDATGVRMRRLPMTPDRVSEELDRGKTS